MMAALLEAWGHHPLHVADGPAALEAVAQRVPDVVLLDIGLPGMDGYEVAATNTGLLRPAPGAHHRPEWLRARGGSPQISCGRLQ